MLRNVLVFCAFAISVFTLSGFSLLGFTGQAYALNADEIVNRANAQAYFVGKDGRAQVKMTITDSQNREHSRRMTILRRDGPDTDSTEGNAYLGEQKFYVYFSRPADVSKMAFLVWKHMDQDDDRWLYLPALDLVKRIAASDKRTSFVGSDFFYEDVSGRLLSEDIHELTETTANYYKLKNTPKDPASVEFAYYDTFIHKHSYLPLKAIYYDESGKKIRTISAAKISKVQGHPTVTKAVASNHLTGSTTVLEYTSVKYDVGLPEDVFSERYLRRPPKKHLR